MCTVAVHAVIYTGIYAHVISMVTESRLHQTIEEIYRVSHFRMELKTLEENVNFTVNNLGIC